LAAANHPETLRHIEGIRFMRRIVHPASMHVNELRKGLAFPVGSHRNRVDPAPSGCYLIALAGVLELLPRAHTATVIPAA
jgi:hypothetical protein